MDGDNTQSGLSALSQYEAASQLSRPQVTTLGPLYDANQNLQSIMPVQQPNSFIPPSIYAPWGPTSSGSVSGFAAGGYAHGARLSTGQVKGPGDGKSDSIPVKTPTGALSSLSDGEFVISAPAVSNLGRGSNDAGARRLDAFHQALLRHDMKGALSAIHE